VSSPGRNGQTGVVSPVGAARLEEGYLDKKPEEGHLVKNQIKRIWT